MSDKFAFISRHILTPEQITLATKAGINLIPVGDRDAFTVTPKEFEEFTGVVVVHPAMALRLINSLRVGVFENANRAKEGEKPSFFAAKLHIFYSFEDASDMNRVAHKHGEHMPDSWTVSIVKNL